VANIEAQRRWKTEALNVEATAHEVFASREIKRAAYFSDEHTLIFHCDATEAANLLKQCGVTIDCVVTSPPFYGQRDYGVSGQIGLEDDPQDYVNKLVAIFSAYLPILKPTASVWVNLGDTYWSGRGQHRSGEIKQEARRFGLRPQDKRRQGPWTKAKQLLLIPHRFAIAMQDNHWIVRNDNVWVKPNPIPDQVRDRCAMSHEYIFHFVRQRFYYFLREEVGRKTTSGSIMPPNDTWIVPPSRGANGHKAAFSEELIRIPILATCPPGGVVLDPFAGSGTTLTFARSVGRRAIGIDIKEDYCEIMKRECMAEQRAGLAQRNGKQPKSRKS
jgi:site-specific DNA-methyltransferase (adenine-specific)